MAIGVCSVAIGMSVVAALTSYAGAPEPPMSQATTPAPPATAPLVPVPITVEHLTGAGFAITPDTQIQLMTIDRHAERIAGQLATFIRRSTGILPRVGSPSSFGAVPAIRLVIGEGPVAAVRIASEGYDLKIAADGVRLTAPDAAGLFYGVQTLRQLLPASAEYEAVLFQKPQPVTLPPLHIRDAPRYQWRGAMLDVARHFFSVADVKRYIDLIALHKMNRLHLHLADDQGWRIEITKWPNLTVEGATTEVGGGPGGFYTQAQYADLVAYAAARFITVIPEIDMPGHTNAALASYAQLNCDGQAPRIFTGTEVGFSSLCVEKEITYQFIDDVVREIAAVTPGPYFHMGGDEVKTLTPAQYKAFVERVQAIIHTHGKQMIGWDEIAVASLTPTSIVQHWRPDAAAAELARAPKLILSPANRTYLDMKYDSGTALGLSWAGFIPLKSAYDWDPDTLVSGVPPGAILGVEAPLWSETAATIRDVEFLAMPRLAAIAEVAWSTKSTHDWEGFRARLGAQASRWSAMGINFYRAPEIEWARFQIHSSLNT